MPFTPLEAAAARKAIFTGDDAALERYLRESGSAPVNAVSSTLTTGVLSVGTNLLGKATGTNVYTLPPATGSQNVIRVVQTATITSGTCVIKSASVADFWVGMVISGTTTFAAGSTEALGGTDALITLAAASGGVKGTVITFTDIAVNLWLVDGILAGTTPATAVGPYA